jgi:hypothetical protein
MAGPIPRSSRLSPEHVAFGDGLAEERRAFYASPEGARAKLLDVAGIAGDPVEQRRAAHFEIAAALALGLDPIKAIARPNPQDPDAGWDFLCNGFRIDAKATKPGNRWCIWPVTKNGLYAADKPFDHLVFGAGWTPSFEVWGWISKHRFARDKWIFPAGPARHLRPGTWYMDRDGLNDLALLIDPDLWFEACYA